MIVERILLNPTSQKSNGIEVFNIDLIDDLLPFCVSYRAAIWLPPRQIGGNHYHLRAEAFIAFQEGVELYWTDCRQERHRLQMKEGTKNYSFIIPSWVPHAIVNTSFDHPALLLELADQKINQTKPCLIYP